MSQEGWSLDQEEAPCTPTAPAAPSLCLNNCGFFGSSATMNLCSSCYKKLVLLKPPPATQACAPLEPEEPKIGVPSQSSSVSPSPELASSLSSPITPVEVAGAPAATNISASCEKGLHLRCFACQKKVVLRGFKCRCGDVFCALHRYSDKHSCSFDYKAAGRASIEKANPVVVADKLHRI